MFKGFPGFGFGDGGFHMSFGIGAFPFSFFTSTFNFGEARPSPGNFYILTFFLKHSMNTKLEVFTANI
jgi:hypothetical protein